MEGFSVGNKVFHRSSVFILKTTTDRSPYVLDYLAEIPSRTKSALADAKLMISETD